MKDIIPAPPAIVRNDVAAIKKLFQKNVVPSYVRFDLAFSHGAGSHLWDVTGKRFLDLGGGIAVCSLVVATPKLVRVVSEHIRCATLAPTSRLA